MHQASSEEHLILDALGGRRKTRGLTCVACNNRLGGTIDAHLEQGLRHFSLLLGAHTGKNRKVAPHPAGLDAGGDRAVLLDHGGGIAVDDSATIQVTYDGVRSEVHIRNGFDDEAIVRGIVGHIISNDLEFKTLEMTGIEATTRRSVKEMAVNWAFGGEDAFRSVAKMGLAAVVAEDRLPRDKLLREIASFVNGDIGLSGARHVAADIDPFSAPAIRHVVGSKFGHHILVIYSNAGHAEVAFVAFGVICHRVRMFKSSRQIGPFAYVVRPVKGEGGRYLERREFGLGGLPSIEDVASRRRALADQAENSPFSHEIRSLLILARLVSERSQATKMAEAFVDASDAGVEGRSVDVVADELLQRLAQGEEVVLPTQRRTIPDLEDRVRRGVEEGRRRRVARAGRKS